MMRIDKAKLRAYLDGELAEPEQEFVEKLLAGSPQAQATLAQLRQERDQVAQVLEVLTPTAESTSLAWWALKRFQARLNLDGQIRPGGPELLSKPADTVWESPSLLAEIITDLKSFQYKWRQSVTKGFILVTITGLMIIVSAVALALWPGVRQQVAEQIQEVVPSESIKLPATEVPDSSQLPLDVVPVSAVFNNEIELTGYKLAQEALGSSRSIDLTLYWHSLQQVSRDYTIFIHLIDSNGMILAQGDSSPLQGKYPTGQWVAGQVLEDIHHIPVVENLPAGNYDLVVGLYDSATFERLSVQSENKPSQDNSILLTQVQVGEGEKVAFELKDVRKLTPCENAGRNHLFIKVQDAGGQGINGVPVKIQWSSTPDGFVVAETETKQNFKGFLEPGHVDFAMFTGTYRVEIQGAVGEIASGLTPNFGVDEPCGAAGLGNSPYHESFEIIFQQTNEAAPAVPFGYGIQANPNGDTDLNITSINELGFEWVKFQMPWKVVEPTQGDYDWALWDKTIDTYAANHIQVMLSIVKAPDWARPADDDKSAEGPPTYPSKYAEFVARVADRYQGKVQAIEVWDEQNLWYKSGGKGRINADGYINLLQSAYPAIKSVNPDMLVISGGLTPAGNVDDLAIDDVEYLKQMYANGAKDYFDAVGAHPSGYNCPALADWRTVTPEEATAESFLEPFNNRHHSWCFLGTMEAYREVMVANSDGGKAIAITEFGWAVGDSPQPGYTYALDNTPVERAKWLIEAYQWGKKQGWVGPMILWNLDYSLTTPVTELGYFSIYYTSAYEALVKMPK